MRSREQRWGPMAMGVTRGPIVRAGNLGEGDAHNWIRRRNPVTGNGSRYANDTSLGGYKRIGRARFVISDIK